MPNWPTDNAVKAMLVGLKRRLRNILLTDMTRGQEKLSLQIGHQACAGLRALTQVETLADVEFQVFSQWGEDGIIEWLVQNLSDLPNSFIEFGVENYTEANTRFLLQNRNWRGLILDGDAQNIAHVKRQEISWKHDLRADSVFVTRENINEIFDRHEFSGEIGLLSIDLDGNDYWIWDAISVVSPVIVVCEYNAVFGDIYPITVPYENDFHRTRAHFSNLYFGASITALVALGKRKGYRFIGSNRAGNNAFFVRQSHADDLLWKIGDVDPRPSLMRESRGRDGRLTLLTGLDRLDAIKRLPVMRVDTGETVNIASLDTPYSENWLSVLKPSS